MSLYALVTSEKKLSTIKEQKPIASFILLNKQHVKVKIRANDF